MDNEAQKTLGLVIGLSGGSMNEWATAVEKAGQSELVHSEKLPLDMGRYQNPPPGFSSKQQMFEGIGIKFGKPVDELFIEATLPPGWKKVRTDHYMWSKVVDDKGRERIMIFFKPEFYDRSAHMDILNRYGFGSHYSDDGKEQTIFIKDCGATLHTIGTATRKGNDRSDWLDYDAEAKRLKAEAEAWLNEHYPDWRNPLAYWD